MRRRDFIKGIAGSTVARPLAAAAQQREQKRRVAVLMGGLTRGEADGQAEVDAFEEGLKEIGWKLGSNIELDYRWPGAELAQVSIAANEIVAMRPDLVAVARHRPRPSCSTGVFLLSSCWWLIQSVRGSCKTWGTLAVVSPVSPFSKLRSAANGSGS